MKNLSPRRIARRHLTSAHVIALVALFVALGGISWAAATAPKNSVASKSIKKNAVTSTKIKNNAVTGRKIKSSSILSSDVKNDALTGTDINEGTLGTVPSAGTATDQFNAYKTASASASNNDPNVARSQATEIPLVSHGSISIYAKCFLDADGGNTYFEVFSRTTANGAIQGGYSVADQLDGNPTALNTSTPETSRKVAEDDVGPNNSTYDYANEVSVLGPDGKGLFLSIQTWGIQGTVPDPPALLPNGNNCLFHYRGSKIG